MSVKQGQNELCRQICPRKNSELCERLGNLNEEKEQIGDQMFYLIHSINRNVNIVGIGY